MSSPFVLPPATLLLVLLLGLLLGAVAAVMAGRAARTAEKRAAAAQGDVAAAELAAYTQELARVRSEHATLAQHRETLRDSAEELRVAHARTETELAGLRASYASLEAAAARDAMEHKRAQADLSEAQAALREAAAQLAAERSAADEKLTLLAEARVELSNQFKTLAAEIFEEKSRRFGEQNTASMDSLLSPLREKLGEFQQRVEALKEDGIAGRSELRTHIEGLRVMNERLSVEASSLVAALKGSSKTQGDWGEMLLEQMLEQAGLRKGHEFRVQESYTREDATRARPDVIVNLPEGRSLVIDAKVSLVDYNTYCACADDASRAAALNRHVSSLRQHIRGLSKREYQAIHELASVDFVLLFVPIEPAYLLALSRDGDLWNEAWKRDVLLVSPGSLYPVIRTVAHLWKQELQERSVQDLVKRGGLLYDKLVLFAEDLVKVGSSLEAARESYEDAVSKLSTGQGNAIRQAEMLRDGGIRTSKRMPKKLLAAWQDDLALILDEPESIVNEPTAGS